MREKKDIDMEEGVEEEAGIVDIQEIPEEAIGRLCSELEAKDKEAKGNHDKFLRAVADLENYKRRTSKEVADAKSYANERLIAEILPVIDNFERALGHANGTDADSPGSIAEGIKLIVDQMFAVLKKAGLEEVAALGEKFDPALHHAISEEESAEAEPGTVVKEFQKGYFLKGKLLRPSMVAVSSAPSVH